MSFTGARNTQTLLVKIVALIKHNGEPTGVVIYHPVTHPCHHISFLPMRVGQELWTYKRNMGFITQQALLSTKTLDNNDNK